MLTYISLLKFRDFIQSVLTRFYMCLSENSSASLYNIYIITCMLLLFKAAQQPLMKSKAELKKFGVQKF